MGCAGSSCSTPKLICGIDATTPVLHTNIDCGCVVKDTHLKSEGRNISPIQNKSPPYASVTPLRIWYFGFWTYPGDPRTQTTPYVLCFTVVLKARMIRESTVDTLAIHIAPLQCFTGIYSVVHQLLTGAPMQCEGNALLAVSR